MWPMGAHIRRLLHLQNFQTRPLMLLGVFVCVQIADAWLTASGIERFGMAAEANPLLALGLILFGPVSALTIAKGAAVGGAITLHRLSRHSLLAALTVLYLLVAILPWAWALAIA
jgi:hypothetical protein